jgi:serine/threonine protein phosphatase PrpC
MLFRFDYFMLTKLHVKCYTSRFCVYRQLKALGQKLGAAGAVVHISRRHGTHPSQSTRQDKGGRSDSSSRGEWILRVANVGDTEVVLCHHGHVVPMTRQFDVTVDAEERQRVVKTGGIITEVGWIFFAFG